MTQTPTTYQVLYYNATHSLILDSVYTGRESFLRALRRSQEINRAVVREV